MADIPQTSKGLLLPPQNTGLWHQHLNQNFEKINELIVGLETTGGTGTGTGDITINPAGGLESTVNGVGVKLATGKSAASLSGLTIDASGTSVVIPAPISTTVDASYAGRVQPLPAHYFYWGRSDIGYASQPYAVPHAVAHQNIVDRVEYLEFSLGKTNSQIEDLSTTIGSINEALEQILGGTVVLTEIKTALSAILRS